MFRMRRYRVFLVFVVLALGALYHFTSLADLETAGAASVEGLKNFGQQVQSSGPPPASEPQKKDDSGSGKLLGPVGAPTTVDSGTSKSSSPGVRESETLLTPTSLTEAPQNDAAAEADDDSTPAQKHSSSAKATPAIGSTSANKTSEEHPGLADPVIDPHGAGGRLEIIADANIPKIHWSQQPEHFPVPTENIIQLPTGKPKAIPKIQHEFKAETADAKAAREEKRDIIRKAFSFSWAGYKKKAWMQDELSPVSGKYRNPFNGWGATLVDSLDTMFMMGLNEEFEAAVEAVKDIDFTTSARNDIPLFETVIRYLGGLIAAYDISDGAHRILLDKAVELADILMGAFDTPNRMPMTFYLWKPAFASQPHRAKTRVVLAELGSLSVEFTRLAQITKEAKYYDAVARITNEFEIWQNNTRLPGLWPQKVDASGCKKPDLSSQIIYDDTAAPPPNMLGDNAQSPSLMDGGPAKKGATEELLQPPDNEPVSKKTVQSASSSKNSTGGADGEKQTAPDSSANNAKNKRAINEETGLDPHHPGSPSSNAPDCEPQGLASPPFTKTEDFGIGGQADSTYEYLPKQYMLLGGLEDKYRTMYETFAEATIKNLLFRPMIPEEKRHILHAGRARVSSSNQSLSLTPEGTHLTCFAGGMFAVGAKIFGRGGDMDIAKKLTDGCLWAYEATTTGIMPDSYLTIPCPDPVDCPWNETLWHERLDPHGAMREQQRTSQQQMILENENARAKQEADEDTAPPIPVMPPSAPGKTESQAYESSDTTLDPETAKTKAEQAVGKPSENKIKEPEQEKAEKAVSKSAEGSVATQDTPEPKEYTEKSASKPVEGSAPPKPLVRRQLGDIDEAPPATAQATPVADVAKMPPAGESIKSEVEKPTASELQQHLSKSIVQDMELKAAMGSTFSNGTAKSTVYVPPPIPTREEYINARIREERLPEGMTKVNNGRYLLRPEAIESIFIMFRATGDEYWRVKGWGMFKAIEKHTIANYGGSAILDVTREKPDLLDEMESFWLAETLKYFYLLFSEPDLVSLDDYVLNTEAHAFKRPK